MTLALSLHAPDDELRNELVPINTRWSVHEAVAAAWEYARVDQAPGLDRVRPDQGHQRPGVAGRPAGRRAQVVRRLGLGARQPHPAEPDAGFEVDGLAAARTSASSSAGSRPRVSRPPCATRAAERSMAPADSSRRRRRDGCDSFPPTAGGVRPRRDIAAYGRHASPPAPWLPSRPSRLPGFSGSWPPHDRRGGCTACSRSWVWRVSRSARTVRSCTTSHGRLILDERPIVDGVLSALVADLRAAVPDIAFAAEARGGLTRESHFDDVHREVDVAVIDDVLELPAPPGKLLARSSDLEAAEFIDLVTDVTGDRAVVAYSGATGLAEISAAGVTKAAVLDELCRERDIEPRDVWAFGDMPNDLAMCAGPARRTPSPTRIPTCRRRPTTSSRPTTRTAWRRCWSRCPRRLLGKGHGLLRTV